MHPNFGLIHFETLGNTNHFNATPINNFKVYIMKVVLLFERSVKIFHFKVFESHIYILVKSKIRDVT